MLTKEQIEKIIEIALANNLVAGGAVGAVVGGVIANNPADVILGTAAGSLAGGVAGAKFGLRLIGLDHQKETVKVQNTSNIRSVIKQYFGSGLGYEKDENGISYFVGVKGSGAANLNPCVLELVLEENNLQILAHAKEGLIKQKTCSKAISALKEYLQKNSVMANN